MPVKRGTRSGPHTRGGTNMTARPTRAKAHIQVHKDGSIWAKGQTIGDVPTGYWEWFRKDGTRMRAGFFDDGKQVGEWTTYDRKGRVYKVTKMKLIKA
jgi:antitoxin component YwqK of YwqJK toxin-antitoxin module